MSTAATRVAFKTPDTLLILLAAALLAALLVPFLPAGLFEAGGPISLQTFVTPRTRFRCTCSPAATTSASSI